MDTGRFKKKLEDELKLVEGELRELGFQNTEGEWEATGGELETMSPTADSNEFADQLEEYQERRTESDTLQARWSELRHALEKLENGRFGFCEVDNAPIEPERLEANPAARTCTKHM
jgi:RNA polymerase-binding transcription factor DksA